MVGECFVGWLSRAVGSVARIVVVETRKPGERPPTSPPNNGQTYLTAHVGSDPVHQGSSASQGYQS